MKALPINVYRNSSLKGCSNNGMSEKFDTLLLIHKEGFIEIDESDIPKNTVEIITRNLWDGEYKHIEPYVKNEKSHYMAGGAFAYSSDSRFSKISNQPLSIHDRVE